MDAIGFDRFFNLSGELAGRCQNQTTWAPGFAQFSGFREQQMQDRQGETSGFASARLCSGQQVAAFQHTGDGLRLNWGGRGVANIGNRTHQWIS